MAVLYMVGLALIVLGVGGALFVHFGLLGVAAVGCAIAGVVAPHVGA